jgi:hypothetical protein
MWIEVYWSGLSRILTTCGFVPPLIPLYWNKTNMIVEIEGAWRIEVYK